ncbi:MAG TPA: right-handed parallel beta-helix repeat-containing protein [Longimicrobiaceae bacterium]|nr:right-handed parallel beta-helix repeat-containing protein [Longimicrobiaceae bacterium]
MKRELTLVVCFGIMAWATPSVSYAQATRTWVSGVGDDVNPCSRTAPCKTFAGAISKTAANGIINCLDPGGFGAVTITKSITIDCTGTLGSVLFTGASSGVVVNGTDIVVTLRNLDINGSGTGLVAVRFTNGRRLNIEGVKISQAGQAGVLVSSMAGAGNVVIKDATISNGVDGIRVGHGITTVNNSIISGNSGFALIAENAGIINADGNIVNYNNVGVQAGNGGAGQTNATVRISHNDVQGNSTGFGCGGGALASDGTNRKGNNVGGVVPVCNPNATITLQ